MKFANFAPVIIARCMTYPGRISAWSEDMVNKVIEDIRANGTEEELKVLEKCGLDSLKME